MKHLVILFLFTFSVPGFSQEINKQKSKINLNSRGSLAYSKDQAFLAISYKNEVQLFATLTRKLSQTLSVEKEISAVSFSPDGKHLLMTSGKEATYWEYGKATKEFTIEAEAELMGACIIEAGKAAVITEKKLIVYDLAQKSVLYAKQVHTKPIRSLAVSADGRIIVTGGGDNNVIAYDAATGQVKLTLPGHKNYIRALDIDPSTTLIASGDDNGLLLIHSLDGKLKQSFSNAKGWIRSVKFSLDGQYVAAGDDWGNIFIYSIEKGELTTRISDSNVPIISMAFSPDGKELSFIEFQKSIKTWIIPELRIPSVFKFRDQKDLMAPQIFVAHPPNIQNDKIRFSKDMIDIKGTVMDESGVRNFKVNGIEVPIKENGNFVIYLPLSMGDNPITIEAKDVNDNISIKKFTIQRKNLDGEQYDAAKARNFLFVVGIDDYEFWPKLNNAVRDATDISGVLMGHYNFQFENITILKNEQATRSNIYQGIRALIEKITPQDNLVIYYSGHGFFDELLNEGYWIPKDAKVRSSGDYLSNSDLLKLLGNIDSQHTFIVADACFSGSLFADSKRGYAENVERYKSRWGLVSGRLEVVSDGTLGNNSPFASAFLQFLRDNTKQKFAVSELVQYVKLKVAETTEQTPLGNPLKGAGDEGGEFIFYWQ